MPEYIKRMSAMTICERYSQHCFETNDNRGQDIADRIFDEITDIPTVDVVKVVRCKDCKYFKPLADGSWINQHRTDGVCNALIDYHDSERYCVQPDHFCSYGELKELGK